MASPLSSGPMGKVVADKMGIFRLRKMADLTPN